MLTNTATAPPPILDRVRAHASLTVSGVRADALASATAYVGVCVLALAAPFETTQPLVRLPSQAISNLEALILVVFLAWFAALVWSRSWPRWDTPLSAPWVALIGVMFISAVATPAARMNALHMTGRFIAAFAVYLLTVNGITTPARLQRALGAALLAGTSVGALVVLEYVQVGPVLQWLKAFRSGQLTVGAQVRAGGPFQYPTIASMYLEVVFAFGLGLLASAVDARRRGWTIAVFVALALTGEAIILTFTRTGLLTMAASLALVGACGYRRRGADKGVALIAALSVLLAAAFFTSRSAQSVWLRLTSVGQEGWYRFTAEAPARIDLVSGRISLVPVTVTNTGRLTWDSHADPPFYLSYHWLDLESDRVVSFDGSRTEFAAPVAPGATVSIDALVRGLRQPGRYRLAWDVVQEGRLWFSTEPGASLGAFSQATVSGSVIGDRAAIVTSPLPRPAVRPGRFVLWRAAARMLAAHPFLGVGPDNFRLLYGGYAALDGAADPRMHSNNMYIEVIVGSGLLGAIALLWLLWRAADRFAFAFRLALTGPLTAGIGIAAAGAAIGLHGLVDSFLSFTPTYVLISLTLGLASACASSVEAQPDAHRV